MLTAASQWSHWDFATDFCRIPCHRYMHPKPIHVSFWSLCTHVNHVNHGPASKSRFPSGNLRTLITCASRKMQTSMNWRPCEVNQLANPPTSTHAHRKKREGQTRDKINGLTPRHVTGTGMTFLSCLGLGLPSGYPTHVILLLHKPNTSVGFEGLWAYYSSTSSYFQQANSGKLIIARIKYLKNPTGIWSFDCKT